MKIVDIFRSVDGEVNMYHQGRFSTFIRLYGCNLRCRGCDTQYSWQGDNFRDLSVSEVLKIVGALKCPKVTITGGEPMVQSEEVFALTKELFHSGYLITIETNGSLPLVGFGVGSWIVDYKLPAFSGGLESKMDESVFLSLTENDFVKFVVADLGDLDFAIKKMNFFKKSGCRATFAFSPCHGKVTPKRLISWLSERECFDVVLNLQLHKYLKVP